MERDLLKANFDVREPLEDEPSEAKEQQIAAVLKKKALASLGGSMVYMERDKLTWDGED